MPCLDMKSMHVLCCRPDTSLLNPATLADAERFASNSANHPCRHHSRRGPCDNAPADAPCLNQAGGKWRYCYAADDGSADDKFAGS